MAHVAAPCRPHVNTVVGLLHLQLRHRLHPVLHRRMDEGGVLGVRVVLQALEVVAVPSDHVGLVDAIFTLPLLDLRMRRRGPLTHKSKDQSPDFMCGVGGYADAGGEGAVGRLARLFDALASAVVRPSVIAALEPTVANPAGMQEGPTMCAAVHQEANGLAVAVSDEILVQDGQAVKSATDLLREGDRLPEAPKIDASRRPRTRLDELALFFRCKHKGLRNLRFPQPGIAYFAVRTPILR